MADSLDDLIDTGGSSSIGDTSFGTSIGNIFQGFAVQAAGSAASAAGALVNKSLNVSQNNYPTPDLAAAAAKPNGTIVGASAAGVSIPILIIGVALIGFLLLKRR
jgi:hypothetical protein